MILLRHFCCLSPCSVILNQLNLIPKLLKPPDDWVAVNFIPCQARGLAQGAFSLHDILIDDFAQSLSLITRVDIGRHFKRIPHFCQFQIWAILGLSTHSAMQLHRLIKHQI